MHLAIARTVRKSAAALAVAAAMTPFAALAWEPTKTVEFIVPAGTGGGADQMARMIQGIVQKEQPDEPASRRHQQVWRRRRPGFLDVKGDRTETLTRSSSLCRTSSPRRSPPACLLLEGHDAGFHAGARRIRPVGERQGAL